MSALHVCKIEANYMGIVALSGRRNGSKLASWGRLVRLHTALATALIPLATYMTVQPLSLHDGVIIVLIAASVHMAICTMNDYLDYEDDLDDPEKSIRPLVSGEISLDSAKWFIVSVLVFSGTVAIYAGPIVLAVTVAGVISATIYNKHSAKTALADVWYVVSIVVLALLGPAISGGYSLSTAILLGVFAVHGFYQVQEGHMKDLKVSEDNFIQRIGVRVMNNGKVYFPREFIATTVLLKTLVIAGLIAIVVQMSEVIVSQHLVVVVILTVSYVGNIAVYYLSLKSWLSKEYSRSNIVRSITLHEVSAVMLVMLSLIPYDTTGAITLIILTPVYLISTNAIIHSDRVSPDI